MCVSHIHIKHDGVVVSAVASQHKGSWFDFSSQCGVCPMLVFSLDPLTGWVYWLNTFYIFLNYLQTLCPKTQSTNYMNQTSDSSGKTHKNQSFTFAQICTVSPSDHITHTSSEKQKQCSENATFSVAVPQKWQKYEIKSEVGPQLPLLQCDVLMPSLT